MEGSKAMINFMISTTHELEMLNLDHPVIYQQKMQYFATWTSVYLLKY